MSDTLKLTRPTLLVMAFATGVSVANLYYNQPLLDQMRTDLGATVQQIGWVPTLTQAGYALGMLFLVSLGDMLERKKLILVFTLLSLLSLIAVAFAPSILFLTVASLVLGLTTMTPQLLIPFAAHLAPEHERGRVVGTMMSGLLLGILLARTAAGFIGAALGWRAMFGIAAALLAALTFALAFLLPRSEPTFQGRYTELLRSVLQIVREQPILREASLFGAMLFGSFSAFWATLIHLMESPAFHYGARAVGLFGLLGAGAAIAGPMVGSIMDRRNPRVSTGIMIAVTFFSFLIYAASARSLVGIAIGVLLMDLGVQAGHISNQTRIFAILPHARSRIQTAYMFSYFTGGAVGSLIGTWAWSQFGWIGVCLSAMAMLLIAAIRYFLPTARTA